MVVEVKFDKFFDDKCFINEEVIVNDIVEVVGCWIGILVVCMF